MSTNQTVTDVEPRVIQSYGIEALVGVSESIAEIREYFLWSRNGTVPLLKLTRRYPEADEGSEKTSLVSKASMLRLFDKQATLVSKKLVERGYARLTESGNLILSWRFRNSSTDDMDIGLGEKVNSNVFRELDALLWEPLPDGPGVEVFLQSLVTTDDRAESSIYPINDNEYWFRSGNDIVAFRFIIKPSPELVQLLAHKLQMILQDRMQNYFHIISSYNADSTMWMEETNRRQRFFEIVEHLLTYTWRPFDMESCEVSIDASGDESAIASGSLRVDFTETGSVSSQFDRMEKRFSAVLSNGREFVVNDVQLRVGGLNNQSAYLSLRLVSRSMGNVDPRRNNLTHRFVKLFIESVGKIIDVVIPVVHRENALKNLRWRYFLDSLRLRALEMGENLHLILTDSIRVLQRLYGISGFMVFSEDRELSHMLDLFGKNGGKERTYEILELPLPVETLLRNQYLLFPIREIEEGRVILYFELPKEGPMAENPEDPLQYLTGTELGRGINEEAMLLGITDMEDYPFFLVTECLTANPKAVLTNLSRRFPVRKRGANLEMITRLTRRVLERYSHFFDLFQTASGNMESGLAYLRGRRDNLTGLYNRQYFKTLLKKNFARPGNELGLMFIDMDDFKIFNDAVSHDFGDKLLVALAHRLLESAHAYGADAVPGRFGGDEFCFSFGGSKLRDFEKASLGVFHAITIKPLDVSFFIDNRSEEDGLEVNLIAFLHRLLRPDIGSRQASRHEYIESPGLTPRQHVVNIWKYYRMMDGSDDKMGASVKASQIVIDLSDQIDGKILYNKIFPVVDDQFREVIRNFITFQLKNYNTDRIRESIIGSLGRLTLERKINLKVSAGLAHSSEHRLRSVDSLFKAADSRAYLAKQNGRNCLFGVDGERLE